ncbi:MAG: PAS domain S-box protein [Chitinophagaceae bacterium]|nr:PAS domain S-box protein [Chitinophagaceae bacterium]
MESKNNDQQAYNSSFNSHQFLVVGLGASAGGIQALKEFFENVTVDSGMAYVVILHLSPDHDSKLAQVLQMAAKIPVTQVTEKQVIEPDHVYVVPPNRHLTMRKGILEVHPNLKIEDRRAPVDIFFRTLAVSYEERAVCVILSGTGANGSMGLKRIKELGGVAFVQNPKEAEFNEMPRNSIATELVDEILPVAEIPAKILGYKDRLDNIEIPLEPERRPEQQQQALREVFTQLRARTGHDFSNYKRPTLLRRIERRINVRGLNDLTSYAEYVVENPDETTALLRDLLISVTNFFRDKKAFDALEREIIPKIFQGKGPKDVVRVWIAGCATGEEAYSIAMLCAERMTDGIDGPRVQIFATDIDDMAIAVAREGLYSINDAADIAPERLRRFFNKENDQFRVRREIREMMLFANHNFLKDPPFSRVDLITCRNVLIYLNQNAQERVMETFHFALKPGGFLFLGSSESVEGSTDLYSAYNRDHYLFQSRFVSAKKYPIPESIPKLRFEQTRSLTSPNPEPLSATRITFSDLHNRLLEQYASPSLVINEEHDIVHLTERAGKYLQMFGGEPSKNLLKLVRPELRLELRTSLYQVAQRRAAMQTRPVKLTIDDHSETIAIHIRPVMRDQDPIGGFILILFERMGEETDVADAILQAEEPVARQLEEELIRVKAQLRNSNEQHEVHAEELKASNEELQAMNEELRSSAEELETSKEELQSINEELRTVNQELKVKIDETTLASNNLQNLVNSAEIGTIFLDRSFRVALFTPAVSKIFNLLPADHGRQLSDITHRLVYTDVLVDSARVLEKLHIIERIVTTTDGNLYMMRILPYRTAEDHIDGVVITFVDVNEREQAELALRESQQHYESLFTSMDEGYCIVQLRFDGENKEVDYEYVEVNPAFEAQNDMKNMIGKTGMELDKTTDPQWFEIYGKVAATGLPVRFENYSHKLNQWFEVYAFRIGKAEDHKVAVLFTNINDRKDSAEAFRKSEEKFRTLFESIDEGFGLIEVLMDSTGLPLDYKFIESNTVFCRQLGVNNVKGMSWSQLSEKLRENWQKVYETAAVTTKSTRFEHYFPNLDKWYSVYSAPLSGDDRQQFALVINDITERKRQEINRQFLLDISERIRSSEEMNHLLVEVCSAVGKHLNVSRCFIAGIETDNDRWIVENDYHSPDLKSIAGEYPISEFGGMFSGVGTTVIDFEKEPATAEAYHRIYRKLGLKSVATIPLFQQDRWTLSLVVAVNENHEWTSFEISLLEMVAERTGVAVEKLRNQQELKSSQDLFRTLIDAIPQVIWTNDSTGKAEYFNERWHEYSGLSYEQSAGPGWQTIVHPDDAHHSKKRWYSALNNSEIFETEYRLQRADGVYRWHIGRNVPLKDQSGNVIRWFGSATDIEDIKKAEQSLRQSEERLRVTVESALDFAIMTLDAKGDIQAWNSGAERIFGYAEKDVLGKSGAIIFTEEDRAEGIPQKEQIIASTDGRAIDERWHLRRDGSRFFMSGVLAPIKSETLIGFVKVGRDMTERKSAEEALLLSEERYRAALKSAEMGAWDWNLVTDTVVWNDQHHIMLGIETNEEKKTSDYLLRFVHPDDIQMIKDQMTTGIEQTGIFHAEYRIIRADSKEVRWMSGYGRVVARENGHPARVVGVMYDVTNRRILEQQKEDFIGIASHELKTPVTSIKAYVEVLRENFEAKRDLENTGLLHKLEVQVDRLTDLIKALLDTTKIVEGKLPLHPEKFDINELIIQFAEDLQRITDRHKIVINTGKIKPIVADRERIGQVLTNLISNAIKYSPNGGDIVINTSHSKNGLKVAVTDKGIGIPEEMKSKVFERFYRISNPRINTFPGLGLGLYITAGIIERHGGTIAVESEAEKGSTFYFTLPYNGIVAL